MITDKHSSKTVLNFIITDVKRIDRKFNVLKSNKIFSTYNYLNLIKALK